MGAILLIRHGQASFGTADYDQLSAVGVEQGRVLGQSLAVRTPKVDHVVCGGMRRHRQTAAAALQAMNLPEQWEEDAGWNEYDHVAVIAAHQPRWADQAAMKQELAAMPDARRVFQQEFEKAIARWVGGQHNADYPESWAGFCARVENGLLRLRERVGKSQTALVFTSGGPITAVVQQLLQLRDDRAFRLNWTLANAAITKLIVTQDRAHLSSLNDHAHFEGARPELITYR